MKRPWTRGRAVVNGELQFVSPSRIAGADHDTGGCLRKWWYRFIGRMPEPESPALAVGNEGHEQIEEYLTTGKMVLGPHALAAKRFLPEPSPNLKVEVSIDDGTLSAAGVPVIGRIDWLNESRLIQLDHGEHYDPEGSVEIVDWKFTGRREFPTSREVAEAIPMHAYGEWAGRRGSTWIRLSHVYISTARRDASKRSVLVRRADFEHRWERAEAVVRRIQQAAGCTSAEQVDANLDACGAYGGCPHRAYCSAGQDKALIDLLGPRGAAAVLQKEEPDMSLLKIPALAALKTTPSAAQVEAEKVRLQAEEAAARRQTIAPAIKAAVETIRAASVVHVQGQALGQPALGGEAAKVWAAVVGLDFQGAGLAGSGHLAATTIMDPADLPRLAVEVSPYAASVSSPAPAAPATPPAAAPATPPTQAPASGYAAGAGGLLPPDAPVSNPAAALAAIEQAKAKPVVVTDQTPVAQIHAAPLAVDPAGSVVKDRNGAASSVPVEKEEGDIKLSKKARAVFEQMQARIAELEASVAEVSTFAARDREPAPTAPAPAGIQVYVDAIPPTAPFTDLGPWVRDIAARLAAHFKLSDVRVEAKGTPLEFGAWRAHLAACYRDADLADGVYFLDARGSDFADIAAEALRTRAAVTRGIR